MKCPRCQAGITSSPDAAGYMVCGGCGARLRRTATQGANVTLPPGTPMSRGLDPSQTLALPDATLGPRPVPSAPKVPSAPRPPRNATPRRVGDETTRGKVMAAIAPPEAPPFTAPPASAPATAAAVEALLVELRAVRKTQDEILELLRYRGGPARGMGEASDDFEGMQQAAVRSSRRKAVLLVDDDDVTRKEVEAALNAGEVPVRMVSDGNRALAAIAEDKPDVIVLELGIGGAMAGKDVVNMIKATMEWVDIPIILYTRVPMDGQKEARQVHGADDFVAKGPGGPEAVLAKAIAFFRKP
jgi:CheY-like chemotaxis protein